MNKLLCYVACVALVKHSIYSHMYQCDIIHFDQQVQSGQTDKTNMFYVHNRALCGYVTWGGAKPQPIALPAASLSVRVCTATTPGQPLATVQFC